VALQPNLGALPKRWTRVDPADRDHSDAPTCFLEGMMPSDGQVIFIRMDGYVIGGPRISVSRSTNFKEV
jgi:hypothetical protein